MSDTKEITPSSAFPQGGQTPVTSGVKPDKNSEYRRGHFRTLFWKAVGITVLSLVLSGILASPLTVSLSVIFAPPEKGDFRITDLYAQVADSRPIRQYIDSIVLLDIGTSGREQIADCLQVLALCGTKAVGLDVNFAHSGDSDSLLLAALNSLPNMVLPLGVEEMGENRFVISDKPFFLDSLPGLKYGVINFPTESERATIREFKACYPIGKYKDFPSFAMAMAGIGNSKTTDRLLSHSDSHELIDFPSKEFTVIPIEEVENRAEEFTGRYVIVGSMNEATDMHSTPISSYMPGMKIHAYSLSSILQERTFRQMPEWMDIALGCILCFIIVFSAVWFASGIRGLCLRIAQVVFLVGVVYIGYALYVDYGFICNFSHTLLMLAFGLFALDVWNGVEWIIKTCITKFKIIKHR